MSLSANLVTTTPAGLAESSHFSNHRFDNYSSWLDREVRAKLRKRGEGQGYGYPIPRAPAPVKKEKPFYVQECSMTSGLLVQRRYNQAANLPFPLDAVRTDPYHYPNQQGVEEEHHFEDRRARSQHIDPTRRKDLPRDKVLRDAVPEEMIKNMMLAQVKDMKQAAMIDPGIQQILFDPKMRPTAESVRELNVDFSCVDLPAKEIPEKEKTRASPSLPPKPAGKPTGKEWSWCLGGRKPLTPPDHGDWKLHKSNSLPGTLAGRSLLSHQVGKYPGAFHGSTHNPAEINSRMRGGRNAAEGCAGTFPNLETRPGAY